MPDIEQAVGMVHSHGYVARLGYIVKAVLAANWHLSTRLTGGRPAPAHPLLTTQAPAQGETKLGAGPLCSEETLQLQMPRQAAATGRAEPLGPCHALSSAECIGGIFMQSDSLCMRLGSNTRTGK